MQRPNETDGSDYINASWIDSYQRRRAYIATQAPMPYTVVEFYQMLWETDSCIVVMLTGQPPQRGAFDGQLPERYAEYWPLKGPLRYGDLLVELISEYQIDNYIVHELKIAPHSNVSHFHKSIILIF